MKGVFRQTEGISQTALLLNNKAGELRLKEEAKRGNGRFSQGWCTAKLIQISRIIFGY